MGVNGAVEKVLQNVFLPQCDKPIIVNCYCLSAIAGVSYYVLYMSVHVTAVGRYIL